jgi:DNA-directed RNA polymerase subunit K/omega
MRKDKTKPSLDKLLLNNVSNKYELVILASKLLKEKAKKDLKIKITPEIIMQALYEVANKDTDEKEISKGKTSKEESVQKKKPEEK